jgi:acylphosphatase
VVKGRVQGVGFRAATASTGRRLSLNGWVRNLIGGSVEVEAEGDAAAIDELVEFLHRGPNGARVKSVDLEWLPPAAPGLEPFHIR